MRQILRLLRGALPPRAGAQPHQRERHGGSPRARRKGLHRSPVAGPERQQLPRSLTRRMGLRHPARTRRRNPRHAPRALHHQPSARFRARHRRCHGRQPRHLRSHPFARAVGFLPRARRHGPPLHPRGIHAAHRVDQECQAPLFSHHRYYRRLSRRDRCRFPADPRPARRSPVRFPLQLQILAAPQYRRAEYGRPHPGRGETAPPASSPGEAARHSDPAKRGAHRRHPGGAGGRPESGPGPVDWPHHLQPDPQLLAPRYQWKRSGRQVPFRPRHPRRPQLARWREREQRYFANPGLTSISGAVCRKLAVCPRVCPTHTLRRRVPKTVKHPARAQRLCNSWCNQDGGGCNNMEVEMKIRGLMMDPVTNMPIVILKDINGNTVLPIWVGVYEANAIALEIEKVSTPRPMTHDLIKTLLLGLDTGVRKVVVSELKDDTFYAVIWLDRNGELISVDSRPSDALALALRLDCPIYVEETVLKSSKLAATVSDKVNNEELRRWLEGLNDEDMRRCKMKATKCEPAPRPEHPSYGGRPRGFHLCARQLHRGRRRYAGQHRDDDRTGLGLPGMARRSTLSRFQGRRNSGERATGGNYP